jgi:hypothetical protein
MAHGIDDDSGGLNNGWTRGINTPGDTGIVLMDPGAPGVGWGAHSIYQNQAFMSTDEFQTQGVSLERGGNLVQDQVPGVFLYSYSAGIDTTGIYLATDPRTVPVAFTKFATGPATASGYTAFGVGRWAGGSILYIGRNEDGLIWATTPGGTTFTATSAPSSYYAKIRAWVSSDPTAPQTAFAFTLCPSAVIRTRNGGATWTNIRGDLPTNACLQDITADPGNADIVFASISSGEVGIWKTTNASAASPHWSRWVAGLPGGCPAPAVLGGFNPGMQITTLDLGAGNRWLYAGFWGGSIWKRRTDGTD